MKCGFSSGLGNDARQLSRTRLFWNSADAPLAIFRESSSEQTSKRISETIPRAPGSLGKYRSIAIRRNRSL